MEAVGPSGLAVQELAELTPSTDADSTAPKDANAHTQEDYVPVTALMNEDDREKGTTSPDSLSGRLETEHEEAFSKSSGSFNASSFKKMTQKSGWRRRACTATFVALLPVAVVSIVSLPTIIHFTALVSAYRQYTAFTLHCRTVLTYIFA